MKIAQAARTFLNASLANCLTRPQRQGWQGEGEGQSAGTDDLLHFDLQTGDVLRHQLTAA